MADAAVVRASAAAAPCPKREEEPFLPFAAPWFGPDEKREIIEALESDWITTGPRTHSFEEAFARFVGCREAIAVNSCTSALHLALVAAGVGAGDAVITTPFTFTATANVIVHCGARPAFVDIRPDTYNIDADEIRRFINDRCEWSPRDRRLRIAATQKRVRAIIAVHFAGHPADMDAINALASEYKLVVIEDAAHALGGAYKGRNAGTLAAMACFSFYATKNISTGEGGMLTTNAPELARRIRVLSLHGISRDAWKRYGKEGSWRYDVEEAGFKYNLTDLASALGIHQLRKAPGFRMRRVALAAQYNARLAALPLKLPTVLPEVQSAWHIYPVQITAGTVARDQVVEGLRRRNIGAGVHFIPLHLMSYYQRAFGYRRGDFPVAERVFERILSLPFFPRMSDEDAERVARALEEILDGKKH